MSELNVTELTNVLNSVLQVYEDLLISPVREGKVKYGTLGVITDKIADVGLLPLPFLSRYFNYYSVFLFNLIFRLYYT